VGEITLFVPPISEIFLLIRAFGPERLSIAFGPPVATCRDLNRLTRSVQ
jgi:hypothetical protein